MYTTSVSGPSERTEMADRTTLSSRRDEAEPGPTQAPGYRRPDANLVRIVVATCVGIGDLDLLLVTDEDTDVALFGALKQRYGMGPVQKTLNSLFLFRTRAVSTATLTRVPNAGLESQTGSLVVDIADAQIEPFLTKALAEPTLLSHTNHLTATGSPYLTATAIQEPASAPKAIVIGWTTSKSHILWLLLLLTALSAAVGVMVGKVDRSASLGIEVTAAVAAILTVVEGVLVLLLR